MFDPNAQGQQPGTDSPAGQGSNEGAGSQEHSGFQKRIDELTREKYDAQRQAQQLAEQTAQQALAIQEMATRLSSIQAGPPVPQVEVDPDQRKTVEAVMSPYLSQMQQLIQQNAEQLSQMQLQQSIARSGSLVPPEVQNLAGQIMTDGKRRGLPIKPDEAVMLAYGKYAMERDAKAQAEAAKKNFNVNGGLPISHQAGTPVNLRQNGQTADLPTNFDRLSPAQKIAVLRQRGVDDMPL